LTGGADFPHRYGRWALVVGGSDGLGAAFAHELAGRGLDLVLVARREAVLDSLARELRGEFPVEVKVLVMDAGIPEGPAALVRATDGLDIGLVVCNAAYSPVGSFLDLTPARLDRMLDLNCRLAAHLAHAMGARLAARGRGGIVLLSSMASLQGAARIAHYAATKAYLRVLAEGLWEELREYGVDVLACCAGRVRTPTFERGRPGPARPLAPPVMEPERVVRETLAALGRRPVVIPGRRNRLAAFATQRLLPRRSVVALVSTATRSMYPDAATGPTESRRRARRGAAGG
jgi:short-subunit dehydrogenase